MSKSPAYSPPIIRGAWAENMQEGNLQFYDKPDPPYPPYQPPPDEKSKKRIMGLKPGIALLLLILVIVVLVGVAVGVAVPLSMKKSSPAAQTTPSSTPSASATGSSDSKTSNPSATSASTTSATPTSTAVTILSANYGGIDVTSEAQSTLQNGDSVVIATDPVKLSDVWFGNKKCLSILHSVGSSIRTFVACEGDGDFTLSPKVSTTSSHLQPITRQGPTSSTFAIVSIVWGALEIRDKAIYQKVFTAQQTETLASWSNDFFGNDTYVNVAKSGVIWYTPDNFKTIKTVSGREGDTMMF